jgi:hypothetical protein
MDNTQLILTLCELVETQNAIIRDMALRLNERDDVDLAERIAAAQTKFNETLGTTATPAVQFSQQGETKK